MEPNHNNYSVGSELPQPLEAASNSVSENNSVPTPEARGKQIPRAVSTSLQPATATTPMSAQSDEPSSINIQSQQSTDAATATMIADDADLIEKEWVVRAKAIVAHTKDDPFNQNREMSKVKADYLKKRYNKDLKVSEG